MPVLRIYLTVLDLLPSHKVHKRISAWYQVLRKVCCVNQHALKGDIVKEKRHSLLAPMPRVLCLLNKHERYLCQWKCISFLFFKTKLIWVNNNNKYMERFQTNYLADETANMIMMTTIIMIFLKSETVFKWFKNFECSFTQEK